MSKIGLNNSVQKARNRGIVLQLITTGFCKSRIELAKRTGLSKMSTTNIVAEFLEKGIFWESESKDPRKGRNPIALSIAPTAPKVIGVQIYRDSCTVLLCDLCLHVLGVESFPMNADTAQKWTDRLIKTIRDLIDAFPEERLAGIGIGSIGPVDTIKGTILNPPDFYGIENVPIVRILEEAFELPVAFDSQYNCAAMAEYYFGNAKEVNDFLFLGIANGVGSGIVSGGRVLRGSRGRTSEAGHISIRADGSPCACGNRGCLEGYISVPAMEKKLKSAFGTALSFHEACERTEYTADPLLQGVLMEMAESLTCGITSLVNLMDLQMIVIGHEGAWIPDRYFIQLENEINRRRFEHEGGRIRVCRPFFGTDSQIIGSACSLLARIFDGELF